MRSEANLVTVEVITKIGINIGIYRHHCIRFVIPTVLTTWDKEGIVERMLGNNSIPTEHSMTNLHGLQV
jgi:hypothetical protein